MIQVVATITHSAHRHRCPFKIQVDTHERVRNAAQIYRERGEKTRLMSLNDDNNVDFMYFTPTTTKMTVDRNSRYHRHFHSFALEHRATYIGRRHSITTHFDQSICYAENNRNRRSTWKLLEIKFLRFPTDFPTYVIIARAGGRGWDSITS